MGGGSSVPAPKSPAKPVVEAAEEKMRGGPHLPRGSIDLGVKGNPRKSVIDPSGRSFARADSLHLVHHGSPDDVLMELLNGNMRFITGDSNHPHQDFKRLQAIQQDQNPICAILGCADSRVPAEIIFDVGFGDMFTCRVAGNIATAEEIASLEYAVLSVKVKLIMVLGHTGCGAVKAALSGKAFPGFIDTLVDHLDMAVVRAQTRNANSFEELAATQKAMRNSKGQPDPHMVELVIRENVLYQLERCKRSTIILQALKEKRVKLVGAVYNLETGEVEMLT